MTLVKETNGLGIYSNGSNTWIIKDIATGVIYDMTNTERKAHNRFNSTLKMTGSL